jgi:hypothetical protein
MYIIHLRPRSLISAALCLHISTLTLSHAQPFLQIWTEAPLLEITLWPHSHSRHFFLISYPLRPWEHHVDCSQFWYSKGTSGINPHVIGPFFSFYHIPRYPLWPTMTPSPDSSTGLKSPELHSLEPPDGRIAHTLTACTRCRQV